jgi:hypothetical protein
MANCTDGRRNNHGTRGNKGGRRPSTGIRPQHSIRAWPDEWEKIKAFIAQVKEETKKKKQDG